MGSAAGGEGPAAEGGAQGGEGTLPDGAEPEPEEEEEGPYGLQWEQVGVVAGLCCLYINIILCSSGPTVRPAARAGVFSKDSCTFIVLCLGLVWFFTGDPFRSGCRTTPTTPRGQQDSPPKAQRHATTKA